MTNNENWQGNPKRSGSGAGRDGKPYEKRDVKSILKGSRGAAKYSQSQPRDNDYSSFKPTFEKRDDRSSYERNDSRPYSSERSEGGRPRFKSTGSRPRFSVKKQGESGGGNYVETRFDNQDNNRRPRIRTADYNPNAKYSRKKQLEYRRNEIDYTKPVRLNKFLANAGICSRREADEFIKAGVITVNGEVVTEMGVKVMHSDKVMFHNQLVRSERKVYLLLNKPKDTVTTAEDTHERRTVLDLVKNACSERIYPVGRLDRNTTGVLLLTNDGDLASRLTHPKYDKKKIYHVTLDKPLEIPDFESVLAGVMLDDEKIAADALNFIKDDDFRQIGIEIHSGQNRVVRRIFEKLGYKVVRLDRVFFAGLTKKNLPRGKYRFLTEREVNMLKMGAYE
ncbi:MAG: pseudouridine synthase [Paludibacter sp.]|nr:pseudouridine synthase [Paludibacter sp.]